MTEEPKGSIFNLVDFNITDSVWGTISFSASVEKRVKEILDSPIFNRLRYTSHLGLVQLIYPSATHTRFSHCIGTAFLCDKVATRLGFEEADKKSFVLSGLLHDIGHPPFSHAFLEGLGELSQKMDMDCKKDSSWGELLIKNLCGQEEIIGISETIKGQKFYSWLLDSNLDLDKMDYLARDSLHSGVPYRPDVDFLINSLIRHEDKVYLKESGVSAAESLMFNRSQMFKTVYYHKSVSGYEIQLTTIIENLIKSGSKNYSTLPSFFIEAQNSSPDKEKLVEYFAELSEFKMWNLLTEI